MKKIKFGLLLILATMITFVSCEDCDEMVGIVDLDGTWDNKDENTNSTTKLIISDNNQTIHGFGSCTPTDCDWGETPINAGDAQSDYISVYTYTWKTQTMNISYDAEKDELTVVTFHDYTEQDGRTDRVVTEYFEQG